ncbi:Abi family protein [Pseudomonas sp. NPDC090203]|jgi:abortive infection bacteriophage resistance protein|uniref:Abi family protein n=1 Tax=Pseudomonas TaxID=286 RepID=UPI002363A1A9|nr:Abi family protein [Pseudomonas putida]MDD1965034.1 Abi family protein [Pseudomonas putida]
MRPFDKPALSVDQQLELLKKRGLHIANEKKAMSLLEVVTLFRLSPYMRPFQETRPDHAFKPGSSLKDIVEVYRFDSSLRSLVMEAIEKVEVAVRAAINNHLSPRLGSGWIADPKSFQSSYAHGELLRPLRLKLADEARKLERERVRNRRNELSEQATQQHMENRARDNYFRFYGATYSAPQLPPAWAMLEEMSLGTVSTLFRALARSRDKKAIASRFKLPFEVLQSWLHTLTFIRNCCAHHSRLWNRELPVRPSLPKSWALLAACHNQPQPSQRLYVVFTMLAYLTDLISPDTQWKARALKMLRDQDASKLRPMGFPVGWSAQEQWN